eukprot:scaffold56187_cov63-Phaeocystis_antarctica.AAC.2
MGRATRRAAARLRRLRRLAAQPAHARAGPRRLDPLRRQQHRAGPLHEGRLSPLRVLSIFKDKDAQARHVPCLRTWHVVYFGRTVEYIIYIIFR